MANEAETKRANAPWVGPSWHASLYSFEPEVRAPMRLPSKVTVIDCTLREGEQMAGIVLNREQKRRVARALDELNIPMIEVGMPSISAGERDSVHEIAHSGLRAEISCPCTAKREDIDRAVDCGVKTVQLSLPAGYLQIEHKLRWEPQKIVDTAVEMSNYAHSQGVGVSMSPYDTTRATPEFLELYLTSLKKYGHADRIRLVDTVGAGTPEGIRYLVQRMRTWIDCPIEVHVHNDFGLALANTLAAITAGASVVNTAFNGMGERAGCAATEEVVLALELLYKVDTGIRTEGFYEVSRLVQELSKIPMQRHKAIVGEGAFAQEAGLIVAGLLREPLVAMTFRPEKVGQTTKILYGKKTGRYSIDAKLQQMGMTATPAQTEAIVERVKEESTRRGGALTDEAVRDIAEAVLAKP